MLIYNDGEIVKSIKEKGITIYNKELDCELEAICSVLNKDVKNKMKNAVEDALEEMRQGGEQIAIITVNVDNEDFVKYANGLSKKTHTRILTICIDEYCDEMKPVLERFLKEKNIDRLIVYYEEIISPEFKETMEELSVKYKFDCEYLNDNQEIVFSNGLKFN